MSITSIEMVAGVGSTHVTVDDQDGHPLLPANIAWTGAPDGLTISPDDTGFVFAALATLAPNSYSATATYNGPGAAGPVTGVLTVVVDAGVTALTFTSP